MKYSESAIKVLFALENEIFKTNAQFWKACSTVAELMRNVPQSRETLEKQCADVLAEIEEQGIDGFICAFDEEFPTIPDKVPNGSKPVLLFYKGDVSLLKTGGRAAVIGELDPTEETELRERKIVKQLTEKGIAIVSGLANGCDSIAHKQCLDSMGKTIAILPSTIGKILPEGNVPLAECIYDNGGLLITEYYAEPKNFYDQTNRYVKRDRLQAFFSDVVVMISSYRKDEGDSGSRHAMETAKKYGIRRYVMYNEGTDRDDPKFGLNRDYVLQENVKPITRNAIEEIVRLKKSDDIYAEQNGYQTSLF